MATRIAVPDRPALDDNDYNLGQDPNWLANFSEQADTTRGDASGLNMYGKSLAGTAQEAQNYAAPETNFGRSQAFGNQQAGAANWLRDYANGPQGPSAAQAQLQQGANQSMRQALSLARSGTGFGESANSLRAAERANADTMANASNQSAILRAQEDQAFRQQQLGAMGTAGGLYGDTAGREGAQSQYLTDTELQAQQMRNAQQLGLGAQSIEAQNLGIQGAIGAQGLGLQGAQSELDARIAQGQTEAQNYGTEADVFATREARDRALAEQRRADRGEAAGMVGQAAAAIGGILSDRRSKKKIRRADRELDAAYAALEGRD